MWLLIGYGNSLRQDDGFGLVVVEKWNQSLEHEAPCLKIETLSAIQLKPEWAEQISKASKVIFVDASANLPPGELRCTPILNDSVMLPGSAGVGRAASLHSPPPVPPAFTLTRSGRDARAPGSFTHNLTPETLLHLAHILYGATPAAWIIEAGARDLDIGESLSPEVEELVSPAIKLIEELVFAQKEKLNSTNAELIQNLAELD